MENERIVHPDMELFGVCRGGQQWTPVFSSATFRTRREGSRMKVLEAIAGKRFREEETPEAYLKKKKLGPQRK